MIILEARAGLGNRIYSIASTYYLAKKCHQDLLVLWDVDDSLAATADLLFSLPPDIQFIYTTGLSLRRAPIRHLKSTRVKTSYKTTASTVLTSISILTLMKYPDGFDYLCELASRPELLYIESYYCFLPSEGNQSGYYEFLTPSAPVMQEARPILEQLTPDTIGLHIRRTDHTAAIQHSPLSAFTERMDKILKGNPSASFFVATDDPETERQLLSAYPHRIITNPAKQFTRRSAGGIIDAYVDILCLSRCARIIGSYGSSFSQVASKLTDIPLEIMDTQTVVHASPHTS
ncbi:MAG: hypothetical protein NC254_07955 [bacterium]|nr:hypothetical protein [bacterium]